MSRPKISVIGAGSVGVACATELARREVGEIVLVDISRDLPAGRALDLVQSGPIGGFHVPITGTDDYGATAGSRVVVITAGTPRRPGMSREDLFSVNSRTIRSVTEKAAAASPEAVLILVTNPLDVMTYLAWQVSGFPPPRVMGQAGVLDSARLRGFIAEACEVSPLDVAAVTLGGHGDTMLPLTRYATVGGLPLETFLSEEQIRAVVDRTRAGGAEIVNLLKNGSAAIAPGLAAARMAESVARNSRRVMPCSVLLEGEYGCRGVFMGVPVVVGAGGAERIVEVALSPEETAAFRASAEAVRRGIEKLEPQGNGNGT